MSRNVFFSFHYGRDAWRAAQVRGAAHLPSGNARGKFRDGVDWEALKQQGDSSVRQWINNQLQGTSVTVVLIGQETAYRPWVKYEIEESAKRGNGLLGVRIHDIPSYVGSQMTIDAPGPDPFASIADPLRFGYTLTYRVPVYDWSPNGRLYLADWIEQAAQQAGR